MLALELLAQLDVRQHDHEEERRDRGEHVRRVEAVPRGALLLVGDRHEDREEQRGHEQQGHEVDHEGVEEVAADDHVEVELGKVPLAHVVGDAEVRVVAREPVAEVGLLDVPSAQDDLLLHAEGIARLGGVVGGEIRHEDDVAVEVLVPHPDPDLFVIQRVLGVVERLAQRGLDVPADDLAGLPPGVGAHRDIAPVSLFHDHRVRRLHGLGQHEAAADVVVRAVEVDLPDVAREVDVPCAGEGQGLHEDPGAHVDRRLAGVIAMTVLVGGQEAPHHRVVDQLRPLGLVAGVHAVPQQAHPDREEQGESTRCQPPPSVPIHHVLPPHAPPQQSATIAGGGEARRTCPSSGRAPVGFGGPPDVVHPACARSPPCANMSESS